MTFPLALRRLFCLSLFVYRTNRRPQARRRKISKQGLFLQLRLERRLTFLPLNHPFERRVCSLDCLRPIYPDTLSFTICVQDICSTMRWGKFGIFLYAQALLCYVRSRLRGQIAGRFLFSFLHSPLLYYHVLRKKGTKNWQCLTWHLLIKFFEHGESCMFDLFRYMAAFWPGSCMSLLDSSGIQRH